MRGGAPCNTFVFLPRFYFVRIICKGDPYPENGAQRRLGVEDFLCMG
jgi:hypothetical protein